MSKRSAQRKRGKRKAHMNPLNRALEPMTLTEEEARELDAILAGKTALPTIPIQGVPRRNPWACPLCGEQRNVAFFSTERCAACQEDAFLLGELFFHVFGLPYTWNDYQILTPSMMQVRAEEARR